MSDLDELLDEMERRLGVVEQLDPPARDEVFGLLDGIDAVHRLALGRLAALLGAGDVDRLRARDPAVGWLLDAYGVGLDERAVAEAALDAVRPYLRSHGGDVRVLRADGGIVRVRLSGACAGCTASTITLRRGVEEALREGFPGFVEMEVEEDDALPHPPPAAPGLLQIESRLPDPPGAP